MKKANILIVDDDKDLIEGLKAILEASNFSVAYALNKTEGLAEIKKSKPDLIILDVNMTTNQEGLEMKVELDKMNEFNNIPVLMQTGIEIMYTNSSVTEMIRSMRTNPEFKDQKVLVVKGHDGTILLDYLSDNGSSVSLPVNGFISKPANPEGLIKEINKLLS